MKVQYSLVYNRTKKLRKNGTALIQIRAYLNGDYKYISTKIYVTPAQWDDRNKKVRKHPIDRQLNEQIRLQIEEMEVFELKTVAAQKGIFHLPQLNNYRSASAFKSFTHFMEVELQKEDVKESTRDSYVTTLTKFKKFRPVVFFEDLTYNMLREFDQFLKAEGNAVNTRAKSHKNIRKFVNLAIKLDLLDINSNPYKRFQVKQELTDRTFLYEKEVEAIAAIELGDFENHLALIIDFFVLSCYTGLRYSDLSRVAREHILQTDKGYKISIISQKTGKPILLPLYQMFPHSKGLTKPERIIKKYLDLHEQYYNNRPFYNNVPFFKKLKKQYINRQLKVIAKKARIQKNLSTHVGRHTFGTMMAQKVKVEILQKLMQHGKLKQTMIYVHMSNDIIESALDKVDWKL